jgi:hypothetical protein
MQPPQRAAAGFQLPTALPSEDNEESLEEMNLRVWSALDPEWMPPPPQEGMGVSGLGMAAGYAGAIVVAAAVALVVTNGILPSISASLSTEDEVAKNQSLPTTTLSDLAKFASVQARMRPDDEPPVPAGILLDAAPAKQIAALKSPAPKSLPSSQAEPARQEIATPTTVAAPEPRPTPSLTRDEIASLLKRSQHLIELGNIASARLILTHLAEAGDAEASFKLAGTFDAVVLANLRVVGVKPDPANARAWYARAADQGSLEAKQRLQQTALR